MAIPIPEEVERMVNEAKTQSEKRVTWQDLFKIINWIASITTGGGGGALQAIEITAADFTAGVYTNSALIGKTPMVDLLLFTNGGTGGLVPKENYGFDDTTGALTIDADNYVIVI